MSLPEKPNRGDSFETNIGAQTRDSLTKKVRQSLASGKELSTLEAFLILSKDRNFDRSDSDAIRRSKIYLRDLITREKASGNVVVVEPVNTETQSRERSPSPDGLWYNPNESYN